MNNFKEYLNYLPYCSPSQARAIKLLNKLNNKKQVAKTLKCSISNLNKFLRRAKNTAITKGYNPNHGITDIHVNATSTLRRGDEDDDFLLRWTKAKTPTDQKIEKILNILESFTYTPIPIIPLNNKAVSDSSLATLYTITDFHLGMYSCKKETLESWNTGIASAVLLNAVQDMVNRSPNSELGILNIQGDFLHWDGLDAVTPANKHVLDAATRFDQMIELSMDLIIWAIEMLLTKHKEVKIIVCEGNHDLAGSGWLRKFLKKNLANNPRATVDDTAIPFYAHLHGEIMLGFHHGHKMKNASLPSLFSSEPRFRKMWGNARYTYIHTGHYHHTEQKMSENGGAIVERHPTLAARDAYAARGGYISMRGARAITYHKTKGEVERITVLPRVKPETEEK